MALKKSSAITTFRGDSLDKIEKYIKLEKKQLAENDELFKPTDIAEGNSADYGKFIMLIDDVNKSFFYVPSVDIEFYSNLTDDEKTELCSDTSVRVVSKTNKKGNVYFITEIK